MLNGLILSIINVPFNQELDKLPNGGNPFKITSLFGFISTAVSWALLIGGLVIFFMIIWAGLQWFYAGDDSGAVSRAKSRLTNSLTGFSLLASSFAIVLVIQYFFGLTIFQQPGTSFVDPSIILPANQITIGLAGATKNDADSIYGYDVYETTQNSVTLSYSCPASYQLINITYNPAGANVPVVQSTATTNATVITVPYNITINFRCSMITGPEEVTQQVYVRKF